MASVLILLVIVFSGCAIPQAPQFRDLTFGQPPASGMVPAAPDSGLPCFSRPSDDLSVGYGKLSSLKYCFYNNQLAAVLITTEGITNSQAMLETLQKKYGPGDHPNEYIPEYYWGLFGAPLRIVYDGNMITNDATIMFSSRALDTEKAAAQGKATSQAGANY